MVWITNVSDFKSIQNKLKSNKQMFDLQCHRFDQYFIDFISFLINLHSDKSKQLDEIFSSSVVSVSVCASVLFQIG